MKVNEKIDAVKKHEAAWAMIDALMEGTAAMRAAGQTYLPKFPKEEDTSYQSRLGVSTLYPAYQRTANVMTGKPFAEPVALSDDMPSVIKDMCEDIDLEGNDIHTWAANAFRNQVITKGYGGILVDFPVVNEGQGARTRAEEKAIGARPYWVLIKEGQILGWKHTRHQGQTLLTQLRLAECVEEDDGEFGVKKIDQIRVFNLFMQPDGKNQVTYTLYRKNAKDEFVVFDGPKPIAKMKKIPFVPLYGVRVAFMIGAPPMVDLAYLNVKHWQNQSDQDNITHVARVPVLAIIGAEEGSNVVVGAGTATKLPMGADMKYVEHSGAALESGEKAVEKLEMQMVMTGAELLVMKPGQRTATESNNEAEGNKSDLQRMVEGFEDSMAQAFQFMADWMGEATGGSVSCFKDFSAWALDAASGSLIKELQAAGLITKKRALTELQRRSILTPDMDPETELEEVEEEGPALGMPGAVDPITGLPIPPQPALPVPPLE